MWQRCEHQTNQYVARKLRSEQETARQQFPSFLLFEAEELEDLVYSGPTLYAKILIQLEYLQNVFLIERLLCRADNATLSLALLQVSAQLVSTTLIFWTHRDRVIGMYDCEWIVMGYGAPAAGILCLHLLRPLAESGAMATGTSRSEVIQMMCLFSGFLDWVKPLTPNRELSACVRRVIQRVLDETLNLVANPLEAAVDTVDWGAEMDISMKDFGFDMLGTFDWILPEAATGDK